jgi:hypothetical protein
MNLSKYNYDVLITDFSDYFRISLHIGKLLLYTKPYSIIYLTNRVYPDSG